MGTEKIMRYEKYLLLMKNRSNEFFIPQNLDTKDTSGSEISPILQQRVPASILTEIMHNSSKFFDMRRQINQPMTFYDFPPEYAKLRHKSS